MNGLRLDPRTPSEFPFLGGSHLTPTSLEFPTISTFVAAFGNYWLITAKNHSHR